MRRQGTGLLQGSYNSLTMRRNRRYWFIVLLGLYLTICVVGGVYLADGTLHPARRPLTEDDAANFRLAVSHANVLTGDVSITTRDGVVLKGWLLRPSQANGDAALVLHGLGDNRVGMSGYAQLLLAHGYAVLMPDARGHGDSGGDLATYGFLERNDVHQWVDYLQAETHPHCIYGLGESMGAAQLLQSLEVEKRFCAVVAESSFSTFREIAYDRMGQPFGLGPWVGRIALRPLVEIAFLRVRWKYGLDMSSISPLEAVAKSRTPVLLIHGQADGNIPVRHGRAIHQEDPRTVLWEVPGADHCGAIALAPEEFERRTSAWFAANRKASTTKDTKDHEENLSYYFASFLFLGFSPVIFHRI